MPEDVLLALSRRLEGDYKHALPYMNPEAYYRALIQSSFPQVEREDRFSAMQQNGFVMMPGLQDKQDAIRVEIGERPFGEKTDRLRPVVSKISSQLSHTQKEGSRGDFDKRLVIYKSPVSGDDVSASKWVEEINHACPVWIHPSFALNLGCKEWDWVLVQGPAGEIKTRVRLSEGIHPEVVAMECMGDAERACHLYRGDAPLRTAGRMGVTVRVVPHHHLLDGPVDLGRVTWAG